MSVHTQSLDEIFARNISIADKMSGERAHSRETNHSVSSQEINDEDRCLTVRNTCTVGT